MHDDRPVPLLRWEPPLARERRPGLRHRRVAIVAFGSVGLALIGVADMLGRNAPVSPRLIWNASASAPIGFWEIHPGAHVERGDMVLAMTPKRIRSLAAARGYVPADVPLLKRVAAGDGEIVCTSGSRVMIDGRLAADRLATDSQRRPLPWWQECRRLDRGQYFLLNVPPDSFDSRYFGPVERSAIVGTATPLWLP